MDQDEEEQQRLAAMQLSDSQIRDSFDALFCLPPASDSQQLQPQPQPPQAKSSAACGGDADELPDIPGTEEEERASSSSSSSMGMGIAGTTANPALTSQFISSLLPSLFGPSPTLPTLPTLPPPPPPPFSTAGLGGGFLANPAAMLSPEALMLLTQMASASTMCLPPLSWPAPVGTSLATTPTATAAMAGPSPAAPTSATTTTTTSTTTSTSTTASSATPALPSLAYPIVADAILPVVSEPAVGDAKKKPRPSRKRKTVESATATTTTSTTCTSTRTRTSTSTSTIANTQPPPTVAASAPHDSSLASPPLMVCSEDETEHKHRRTDRNAREQHRAQQITLQIASLRDLLLQTSDIQFKPDKFSTLLTAAQYIRQLQKKAAHLSSEHQNLLRTLQQASDTLQRSAMGKSPADHDQEEKVDQLSETFIQQGIPHQMLFRVCPAPMCLVRMDGRFLDANARLENLLNTKVDRLMDDGTTFFNVLERSSIENVFCAMSRLLEVPSSLISSDLTNATTSTAGTASGTATGTATRDDTTHNTTNADNKGSAQQSVLSSSTGGGSRSSSGSDEASSSSSSSSSASSALDNGSKDSFSEQVVLAHNGRKAILRINIVRSDETQVPRFFVCTFSPLDATASSTLSTSSSSTSLAAEESESSFGT